MNYPYKVPSETKQMPHEKPPPQEVEVKSLLLKRPCTSDTGSRGPSVESVLKASSLRTSFYGTRGPCKLPKDRSNQHSYLVMTPINHSKDQHGRVTLGCSSGMHTLAVTNGSLIGFKIHSTRGKPCLVLDT